MKAKEYIVFYLKWVALTVLLIIDIAILTILGISSLIATPLGRPRHHKLAINCILIGIREEAKKLM